MIDFNTKLGHWPYRPVRGIDALLETMDVFGIERTVVSSLSAVHYFNPHEGNEELIRAVDAHRDRLISFAVLKPNFAGSLEDLETCLSEYGMKGLVLYPNYHRFSLDEPGLEPFMARAAAAGLPVCVQSGMEDPRRQYDREIIDQVPPEAIGGFARRYPEVSVVALGLKWGQPEQLGDPWPENCFFDTSNYETMGELEQAVAQFGAERRGYAAGRILFGTHFPLFAPLANIDKLRCAALTDTERHAIAHANAESLLP